MSHSLCGILREADPRVKSRTEPPAATANTPPAAFVSLLGEIGRTVSIVLSSIGHNEFKFERY